MPAMSVAHGRGPTQTWVCPRFKRRQMSALRPTAKPTLAPKPAKMFQGRPRGNFHTFAVASFLGEINFHSQCYLSAAFFRFMSTGSFHCTAMLKHFTLWHTSGNLSLMIVCVCAVVNANPMVANRVYSREICMQACLHRPTM